MSKYEELFEIAEPFQLAQLEKHDKDKDGWDCIDIDYATSKIRKHYKKLYDLIDTENPTEEIDTQIRKEAANIANYAQMILMSLEGE